MKTTRAQIESKCAALNRLLGRPEESYTQGADGKYTANIGNIHVGHSLTGWEICEMHNAGGGVSQPFGSYRMTAFECWMVLNAACAAVQMTQAQRMECAA